MKRLFLYEDNDEGSIIPLYLGSLVLICLVIGFTIDLSSAWLLRSATLNDLAAARDQVSSAPYALVVKNSDDPGAETAKQIASAMRDNGYPGEIRVWFYEVPEDQLPDSKRVMAWTAQVARPFEAPFSKHIGFPSIDVAADITSSSIPYSGGDTWRPDAAAVSSSCALYTFTAGSDTRYSKKTVGPFGSTAWPVPLKNAVAGRLQQIADNAV